MTKSTDNQTLEKTATSTAIIDMAALATFFAMMRAVFFETVRLVCLPIAAAAATIQAIIAWRQSQLSGHKRHLVVHAAIETVAAVGITAAVVCALAFQAATGAAAAIIFASITAAKTLYHAGTACYNWGKSNAASDPQDKEKFRQRARAHVKQTLVAAMCTVAVMAVMVFGHIKLAAIGVAAGVAGAVSGLSKALGWCQSPKDEEKLLAGNEPQDPVADPVSDRVVSDRFDPAKRPGLRRRNTYGNLAGQLGAPAKPDSVYDGSSGGTIPVNIPNPTERKAKFYDDYHRARSARGTSSPPSDRPVKIGRNWL